MEYETVFDIAVVGYKNWDFPALGLLVMALGAFIMAISKYSRWRDGQSPRARKVFAFVYFGFGALWTATAFINTYGQYSALAKAANSYRARVVEGIVANFKPKLSGRGMESFCVSGTCFEYSDNVVTAGFNYTAYYGGPIRDGLRVRVTYVGNAIVKLEVVR